MKLIKYDLPTYETKLPVSQKDITYRPYTSKEEKILMLAAQGSDADHERAIMQLIGNCASVDVATLHPTDVEWLFIQMRSVSVGSTVDIDIQVPDDCEGANEMPCPGVIQSGANFEYVKIVDKLKDDYPAMKAGGRLVQIDSTVGLVLNVVTGNSDESMLYDSLVCIFQGDEVIERQDIEQKEFIEWLDTLPPKLTDKIEFFIKNQPYLEYEVNGKCGVCGYTVNTRLQGISDFFG